MTGTILRGFMSKFFFVKQHFPREANFGDDHLPDLIILENCPAEA